ncbi:restriction endonuclease subunit S [Helicobacter pylori]|nr:restriction endonuclease subunit S [Helicobacter pylori]
MNQIERLLHTLVPKGVEFRKLGEVCDFQKGKSITKKAVTFGKVPVISGGRQPAYYHNEANRSGETIAISSSGVYAGYVSYWDIPVFLADSFSVSPKQKTLMPKYLFYYLTTQQDTIHATKSTGGIPHVYSKDLQNFLIPIPPLEIQQEIVKILDAFTELNTELNARKKQYKYYQNMLLDFNDINQNRKDAKISAKPYPKRLKTLLQTLAPKGVEFKKIGELFKRNKGINITAAQMKKLHSEIGKVRIFAGGATKADINYKDISQKDIINCESVIIKSRGNIGFEYYNQPFSHKNEIWSYSLKTNQMLVKFLYYYLSNNQDYFQKLAQSSSVKLPQLSVSDTDEYEVPVPPLEIQQEIVKILDQFSALTTDLQSGIPAEIEARKKQYEYYREKLLTFKPLTPNKEVKKC